MLITVFRGRLINDDVCTAVDDGAILDMQFSHFFHEPPPGYEQIMIEKSLL